MNRNNKNNKMKNVFLDQNKIKKKNKNNEIWREKNTDNLTMCLAISFTLSMSKSMNLSMEIFETVQCFLWRHEF